MVWRLDALEFAATWSQGIGAERVGGRWNPKGFAAVYCSIDPSTCILESAVHRGFKVLDTRPHVLTRIELDPAGMLRTVHPDEVPNPAWLEGGVPGSGQQAFGADLMGRHDFVALPSVVSRLSWNLVFSPARAAGRFRQVDQVRVVLDTRLNPPSAGSG